MSSMLSKILDDLFGKNRVPGGITPRSWLPHNGQLIFTLRLKNLADPLNADRLWDSGGELQQEDEQAAPSPLRSLRSALNDHPGTTSRTPQGYKFPVPFHEAFTDVAIWISPDIWYEQEVSGFQDLYCFIEKLEYRHAEDFKNKLYLNREPRYSVMPLAELEPHQIICQFGMGVFIPGPDDGKPSGHIDILDGDGQAHSLPDWWFLIKNGDDQLVQKITRPAGFYRKQYFLVVGGEKQEAAIRSPLWLRNGGTLIINTRSPEPVVNGDRKLLEVDSCTKQENETLCRFHAKANPGERLSLRIRPVTEAFSPSEPANDSSNAKRSISNATFVETEEEEDNHRSPLSGYTFVDSDEPEVRYLLCLTAIALPLSNQLPGNNRYWLLSLDRDGFPAAADRPVAWQLRGDVRGSLSWKAVEDEVWQSLPLPAEGQPSRLPFSGTSNADLTLEASPNPGKILALYRLPMPLTIMVLSEQRYTLGRNADITLDLLARPDSLQGGTSNVGTLNNLRFSGEHAAIELTSNGRLQFTHISQNAPSFVRSANQAIKALTGANDNAALEADDSFIIGGYQLQFKSMQYD